MSQDLERSEKVAAERVKQLGEVVRKFMGEFGDFGQKILDVIDTAITSESPVISILGVSMLADLLAGGAYTSPVQMQPYYSPLTRHEVSLSGDLWTLPDGSQVITPFGSKPEQHEAIVNGNVPTRFPRLLSGQMKFLVKEYISLMFFTSLAKDVVVPTITGLVGPSGLRTLVKGSKINAAGGKAQTLPLAVMPSSVAEERVGPA